MLKKILKENLKLFKNICVTLREMILRKYKNNKNKKLIRTNLNQNIILKIT